MYARNRCSRKTARVQRQLYGEDTNLARHHFRSAAVSCLISVISCNQSMLDAVWKYLQSYSLSSDPSLAFSDVLICISLLLVFLSHFHLTYASSTPCIKHTPLTVICRYGTTSPGPFRFDASTSGYSTQQTMDESNEYFNTSTRRFAGSPFPAISDQIWENKTSTSSKPTPSPFDELGAYIKSQPSQFNVASPQDAFTSVDKAVKYFSRQCIKVEGKLNHAPFVKKVCQTLVNNNWTFRAFIDERGGLENFLAATQGGYAHEISEPRWIKVSRVEEGTMWFHVSIEILLP